MLQQAGYSHYTKKVAHELTVPPFAGILATNHC